jgi:hypothetical protein
MAETGTRLRESGSGVTGKRDMGPTAILQPNLLKMNTQGLNNIVGINRLRNSESRRRRRVIRLGTLPASRTEPGPAGSATHHRLLGRPA